MKVSSTEPPLSPSLAKKIPKFVCKMSTYFSKALKAGGRLREFNFRLLSPQDPFCYRVDVADEKGDRLLFELRGKDGGTWVVTGTSLPSWASEAEAALGEAVEANRKTEAEK